jgi:hypothetical protein
MESAVIPLIQAGRLDLHVAINGPETWHFGCNQQLAVASEAKISANAHLSREA